MTSRQIVTQYESVHGNYFFFSFLLTLRAFGVAGELMRCCDVRGVWVYTLQKEMRKTEAIAAPSREVQSKSSIDNRYTCSRASPNVTVTSIFFFPR